MRKFRLLLAMFPLFLIWATTLEAQVKTVSGTILAEDNQSPLSGVTIKVKGTRRVAQTDANGKFSIQTSVGETLQISYVGYVTQDLKVGASNTIGISLKTADNTMGEVVVTAMDIKRNPRSMGYSTQTLKGEEIQETQRENFINGLLQGGKRRGLLTQPIPGLAHIRPQHASEQKTRRHRLAFTHPAVGVCQRGFDKSIICTLDHDIQQRINTFLQS